MAATMTSITTMPSSSSHNQANDSRGSTTSAKWRDQYPTEVTVRIRRIVGAGDVWVGELSASYDGGPWMLGISVHEFRGERIAHERIYVTEPWTAPEWRTPWRGPRPPSDVGASTNRGIRSLSDAMARR